MRAGELERVLEEVRNSTGEDLPVAFDGHRRISGRRDREIHLPRLCLDEGADLDLLHECGDRDELQVLNPRIEANLGERTINEIAQAKEAAVDHTGRTAARSHLTGLDHLERKHARVEMVAELVGEDPQALRTVRQDRALALTRELCRRLRDRVIQA